MKACGERFVFFPVLVNIIFLCLLSPAASSRETPTIPGGELKILDADRRSAGFCPLEHTDVDVAISGFIARVHVKQIFRNPLDVKIEAVYAFPLPHDAAVDDMVMIVGNRRIRSQIKKRAEARKIYEAAREAGRVAGLLDQERPNIFTQSVANIEPGAEVSIDISYVETLEYEDGIFELVFPMVVEPRYMPGCPVGKEGTGWARDTCLVPDASRISPPVARPGTRAGHDISLNVTIDAGMRLSEIESVLHDVEITHQGPGKASLSLRRKAEIPNRDFILRYGLGNEEIGDAFFIHEDERGKFFTLVLQPPRRYVPMQLVPRELIFVLDTSGSMRGHPIDKAKETMSRALDSMRAGDTFNIILFSGETRILWNEPRPNTTENRTLAQKFLARQSGRGGTEMMKAINAALCKRSSEARSCPHHRAAEPGQESGHPPSIRIVCFMTDGCVGNDFAIIDAVKRNADTTRVFSFGIGQSTNRFLLDGMAHAGRGEVEYVTLNSYAGAAVERFYQRILAPLLTDIEIDWGGLPVFDVYPRRIPDLFSAKPVVIHGRLRDHAQAAITLRGQTGSGPFARRIRIDSSRATGATDSLASLWARAKVKCLMHQDLAGLRKGNFCKELTEAVTALGLGFRLMTRFTSFVAVEESTITGEGTPIRISVPVELPDGVSHEGIFGPATYSGSGCFLVGRGTKGARTGGMARKRYSGGLGYERWEFWWAYNKEAFLNRSNRFGRRAERAEKKETAGKCDRKEGASEAPTADVIGKEILQALTNALGVDHPDILDSAVLAIARTTRAEDAPLVLEKIKSLLGSKYKTVRQSACLSLGVLGAPEAVPICRDLMTDSGAGRKLTGCAKVPALVRAFAALSLGLIGMEEGTEETSRPLRSVIENEDPKTQKDLIACAILSLGLIGDNDAGCRNVDFLIGLLENTEMEPFLKANVPIALAKLGNPIALSPLVDLFESENLNDWIRQSCAIAMGQLAGIENENVIDLLMKYVREGKDTQTRHFAFIALGQIGARDQDRAVHAERQKRIAQFFLEEIDRPRKVHHLSWASIAGAIHARDDEFLKNPVASKLREKFSRNKNPSEKGAIAISLGLLNDLGSAEKLFAELNGTKDKSLQGYLCISLGMMQWTRATNKIRDIAENEIYFRLRLQAAAALGVMGDPKAVGLLVKALENGQTLSVCASAAKALSLIGDGRAIPSLRKILADPRAKDLVRAFAAVALGMIAEKSQRPWNAVLSENINYRAKVDAISEILDIL